MFDFDGNVLTPLQNTYSRPITINPVVSQPGAAPYAGRGVFATGPVDIATAAVADLVFSDQRTSIWVRMAEYPICRGSAIRL